MARAAPHPSAKKRTTTKTQTPAPPTWLPSGYPRAIAALAGRHVDLDWRKLARKRPRIWPGSIWLWTTAAAAKENASFAPMLDKRLRGDVYFIGTNTAGLLYAIDVRGRVVVIDECEMAYPEPLAPNFETFVSAFVVEKEAQEALATREQAAALRAMPARWKKVDALLAVGAPKPRPELVRARLVDIANDYLLAGRKDQLLAELRAFAARHPGRRAIVTKLRAYAERWGTRR
jgi:hypothetical protein